MHVSFIVLVDIVDDFLHFLVVLSCVLERKVTTPRKDDMICSMYAVNEFVDVVYELHHFLLGIEGLKSLICFEGVVVVNLKVRAPAVVVAEKRGQDLLLGAEVFLGRSPEELHGAVLEPLVFVKTVDSCKELGLKAKLSEEACIGSRVAKRVKVPSNSWTNPKFTLQESMTDHHVINQVLVVRTSFISGTPSAVCELKSAFFNKLLNLSLHLLCLAVVPHSKVFHLDVSEDSLWVLDQLFNHCIKNKSHISMLRILVCAREVLVDRLDPAYIVMGMSYEMYSKLLFVLVRSIYRLDIWMFAKIGVNRLLPILNSFMLSLKASTRLPLYRRIFIVGVFCTTRHLVPILDVIAHHLLLAKVLRIRVSLNTLSLLNKKA